MKPHLLLIPLALVLLAGCGNSERPGIFTTPWSFLDNVPLGASQDEMFQKLGPPDTQSTVGARTIWGYKIGEGLGKRTFSYEFVDGKLDDARYFEEAGGNYKSAKQRRAENAAEAPAAPQPDAKPRR